MITVDIKSLLERLNKYSKSSLEEAASACMTRTHYEIAIEHMLQKLIEDTHSDIPLILKHFNIRVSDFEVAVNNTLEEFKTGNGAKPVFSPRIIEWFQESQLTSTVDLDEAQIRSGALLLAFINKPVQFSSNGISDVLEPVNPDELKIQFKTIVQNSVESPKSKTFPAQEEKPGARSALGKYCEDFTQKAREGKIDPVFGRDREIRQMIDIFARRRKNNPIVVGEAGVGKTAVVEGLALRIVEDDVPDFLKNVSLLSLDMGLLQAGAGVKGEFENRLKNVIEEVKSSEKPIIMFIDEAHTMIGAGASAGGSDAANLLKPALARGELRTVAATTWSEYKKYFEKDAALARRFQLVYLDEPSEETATLILRGLKDKYEDSHGVIIRDDAVQAASEFSSRYISGRYLPDKAIDLLDTSAARVKVLLTSKPDVVEDLERKVAAIKREKRAIERDQLHGIEFDKDGLDNAVSQLKELEIELKTLTSRWEKEQQLATELISLREKLVALNLDTEVKDPSDQAPVDLADNEEKQGTGEEKQGEGIREQGIENDETSANIEPVEEAPPITREELKTRMEEVTLELEKVRDGQVLVRTEVDPELVSKVVSDWTGIPVGKVMHDEAQGIIDLEENLKKHIKGQDESVHGISRIIKASKAGLTDPDQPMAVFLLVGPSGVGKTETGIAMAEQLFGGERFIVSVNMSEFQEKHTVSRLIGSPPGYIGYGEGGVLTEAVRQRPYSVVLLDEAEKANTEVMNLFYQVFDKGILSDGEGRDIDFKNTVIFMTSNLASDVITELCKDDDKPDAETMVAAIRPILSDHFKPALLARMNIVPYFTLDTDVLKQIVDIKLEKLSRRLSETHKMTFEYSDAVREQIAARCLEVETGARNIDYIMNGTILPIISREILGLMTKDEIINKAILDVDEDGGFGISFEN